MQWRHDLASEQAAIEARLTELHHRKSALEVEQAITADLTIARAQARARDIISATNHEGTQCPTFARASQNVGPYLIWSTW
jgi:hypothetical protein